MNFLHKLAIALIFTLSSQALAEDDKFNDLILYTDHLNSKFLDKNKEKSIEVAKQIDALIEQMYGYEEVEALKTFKQEFIKKYISRANYIDEANKNLREILHERRNKQIIIYEEEVNSNRNLLK